jgi:hypothetical protein
MIDHARGHILKAFEILTSIRKQGHSAYLASLPNYDIYMRYSGRPPISPIYVATLQAQIQESHAELKRGIDADWRASVLRYPVVLDYFYSLVELRIPSDQSPRVAGYELKLEPTDTFRVSERPLFPTRAKTPPEPLKRPQGPGPALYRRP